MPAHSQVPELKAEADLLAAAADEFHALARSLDSIGRPAIALQLYSAASALDRALPQQDAWWRNPFNGQEGRSQLFLRLLDAIRPSAVIETGTFRGTTTVFMAEHFEGPIFTCEIDQRWYLTAQINLKRFSNVDARRQDSREFLKAVFAETQDDPLFIYLDAHWREDLPLSTELELILSSGRSVVVVIDDFAVPFDREYQFDDYGLGKALTLELLAQVDRKGASLFFPTLPAIEETGARRGCAVIGVGHAASELLSLAELRQYDWPTITGMSVQIESRVSSLPNQLPDLEPLRRLVMSRDIEIDRTTAETLRRECGELRANEEVLRREFEVDLAEARTEAEMLRQQCNAHRLNVAALYSSISWRVTAPLRGIARLLKR